MASGQGSCGRTIVENAIRCVHCHLDIKDRIPLVPWMQHTAIGRPCEVCKQPTHETEMLVCDSCHRGFHTSCITPTITEIPAGNWFCSGCIKAGVSNVTGKTAQSKLMEVPVQKHVVQYLGTAGKPQRITPITIGIQPTAQRYKSYKSLIGTQSVGMAIDNASSELKLGQRSVVPNPTLGNGDPVDSTNPDYQQPDSNFLDFTLHNETLADQGLRQQFTVSVQPPNNVISAAYRGREPKLGMMTRSRHRSVLSASSVFRQPFLCGYYTHEGVLQMLQQAMPGEWAADDVHRTLRGCPTLRLVAPPVNGAVLQIQELIMLENCLQLSRIGTIMDPCCGVENMVKRYFRYFQRRFTVLTNDLSHQVRADTRVDALDVNTYTSGRGQISAIISDPPSAALDLFLPLWIQVVQTVVCVRAPTSYFVDPPVPRSRFLQHLDDSGCLKVFKTEQGKINKIDYVWIVLFKHPAIRTLISGH